jgi:hypothetical protein
MTTVGTLSVGITGDTAGLDRSLDKAKKEVNAFATSADKMAQRFQAAGKKMTDVGKKLSTFVTAPIVALGTFSVTVALQTDRLTASLEGLAGGSEGAEEYIEAIGRASLGTVSRVDALAVANKALTLNVVATADEMAKLTEIAITLGRAQGLTATQAVSDLTTALGRQSPMILDNLGITLKMEEAYGIYAEQLGKTVDQLTAAEKQQAFLNAALQKGSEVVDRLGGLQDDTAGKIEQLRAKFSDLRAEIGQALIPIVEDVVDTISVWIEKFQALDPSTKEMIVKIGLFAAAIGPVILIVGQLTKAVGLLSSALAFLAANPIVALIAGLSAAVGGLVWFGMSLARYTRPMAELGEETERTLEKVEGFGEVIVETGRALRDTVGPDESATAFHGFSDSLDFATESIIELQMGLLDLPHPLAETTEEVEEVTEAVEEMTEAFSTEVIEAAEAAFVEYSEALAATKRGSLDYIVAVQDIQEEYAALIEAQEAIIAQGDEMDPRLEALIERYEALGIAFDAVTPKAQTLRRAMEEFMQTADRNWTSTLDKMVSSLERIYTSLVDGIADMVRHNRELAESYKDTQQDILDTQREAIDQANEEMIRARDNVRRDLSQGEIDAQEYADRMAEIEEEYTRQVQDAAVARSNAMADAREAYEEEKRTLGEVLKDTLRMIISAIKQELLAEAAKYTVRGTVALILADTAAAKKYYAAAAAMTTGAAGLAIVGFEKGGIVEGALGAPVPAIVHGGEMILTPEQQAQMFDYSLFSQAVANGVYEAMSEVLPGSERPVILQIDGTRFARVIYPALSREEQRLGLATT